MSARQAGKLMIAGVLAGTVSLVLASGAMAAPTVGFQPSFGSEDHLSEGGTLTTTLTFAGTEYHGVPEPLTSVKLYLPVGTGLSGSGFATCEAAVLRELGPEGCPTGSVAGPTGAFTWVVNLGEKITGESGTIQPFFAPGGGLNLWFFGHEPTVFEYVAETSLGTSSAPLGTTLAFSLPLFELVPGAPDVSFSLLELKLGATREEGLISSLTLPGECPGGQLHWAADAGYEGAPASRVSNVERACPPAATGEGARKLHDAEVAKKAGQEAAQRAAEAAAKKASEEATAKAAAAAAAAKLKAEEAAASVKIVKFKVTATSLKVTVKQATAGTLTLSGQGLKKLVAHLGAGTHVLTVTLTKAGKAARRAHKKIKLTVALQTGSRGVAGVLKVKL